MNDKIYNAEDYQEMYAAIMDSLYETTASKLKKKGSNFTPPKKKRKKK